MTKKTDKYQAAPQRGPPPLPSRTFKTVVPNLRSQPTSGSRGSGVGFVEILIIRKVTSSYLEANALSNQHMYEFLDLTSNIKNLILCSISGNVM